MQKYEIIYVLVIAWEIKIFDNTLQLGDHDNIRLEAVLWGVKRWVVMRMPVLASDINKFEANGVHKTRDVVVGEEDVGGSPDSGGWTSKSDFNVESNQSVKI